MDAKTREQLINAKGYYEIAVDFHKREGNTGQVEFFSEGLDLIEKRLIKLTPTAC